MTLKVLVTGASGRTGRLVFQKLHQNPNFEARGMVRDETRGKEAVGDDANLVIGDITDPTTLPDSFKGMEALVILTSASPRKKEGPADAPPVFTWDDNGRPEQVDWQGARNQIDAAKAAGIKHVVFVGSMGSSDENHPLNRIGNGNILRFKRKAEIYLTESGMPYTIINPGGLLNEREGERELLVGNNDELFTVFGTASCSIPRGDVARVVVSALGTEEAKNKALDLVARPAGEGDITVDPAPLFAKVGPNL